MICPRCQQPTHRLISDKRGMACADCRGLSETGGAKLDGILTRNSDRVRTQQQQHEGDMILPHRFDKHLNKIVPNEDFVDKYPDQLPTYFTEQELNTAGYSKAGSIFERKAAKEAEVDKEREEVEFVEDDAKVAETIEAVQSAA